MLSYVLSQGWWRLTYLSSPERTANEFSTQPCNPNMYAVSEEPAFREFRIAELQLQPQLALYRLRQSKPVIRGAINRGMTQITIVG